MSHFQAPCRVYSSPAETLWVWHTSVNYLAPQKWKGILVKILVQQSYFKSGEKMNTERGR